MAKMDIYYDGKLVKTFEPRSVINKETAANLYANALFMYNLLKQFEVVAFDAIVSVHTDKANSEDDLSALRKLVDNVYDFSNFAEVIDFGDNDEEVFDPMPELYEEWQSVDRWGKRLSEGFNHVMNTRVCTYSKLIYAVMHETCTIIDQLLWEGTYSVDLTREVRGRLARLLRIIDDK